MVTLDEADGNVKLNSDVNVALDSLALYLWKLSIRPQWDHWEGMTVIHLSFHNPAWTVSLQELVIGKNSLLLTKILYVLRK